MENKGIYQQIQEPIRQVSLDIGLSSVIVADARNEHNIRKVITIRNISSDPLDIITINFGKTAEADTGIILKQFESFTDTNSEGYIAFQGTITGVCSTANGKIAIFER